MADLFSEMNAEVQTKLNAYTEEFRKSVDRHVTGIIGTLMTKTMGTDIHKSYICELNNIATIGTVEEIDLLMKTMIERGLGKFPVRFIAHMKYKDTPIVTDWFCLEIYGKELPESANPYFPLSNDGIVKYADGNPFKLPDSDSEGSYHLNVDLIDLSIEFSFIPQ